MDLLRAFIAIDIPSEIKKAIAFHTSTLHSQTGKAVRWVASENIHLTLKFLGDLSPDHVELISNAIQSECSQQPPFDITVGGHGTFPNLNHPRVIWVGLQSPAELLRLQQKIESRLAGLGYTGDGKPFSAHLTIGRVREGLSPDQMKLLKSALLGLQIAELGAFTVHSVTLFKSDLQPAGSVYTALYNARMGT